MTKLEAMCMHVANILSSAGIDCADSDLMDAILTYEDATGYMVAIHTKQNREQQVKALVEAASGALLNWGAYYIEGNGQSNWALVSGKYYKALAPFTEASNAQSI